MRGHLIFIPSFSMIKNLGANEPHQVRDGTWNTDVCNIKESVHALPGLRR